MTSVAEGNRILASITALSALGAFAYYVYYSSTFATFYLLAIMVGVLFLRFDPEQFHVKDWSRTIVIGFIGFVTCIIVVIGVNAILAQVGLTPQVAVMYPVAASTLDVIWVALTSPVALEQAWYWLVTMGAMMFVAVAENLLFFGGVLLMFTGVESGEGEKGKVMNNTIACLVTAVLFGLFHVYKVYGGIDYAQNFLANPIPILGLIILGFIWGNMTLYIGLTPSIIVHFLWNMFVILIAVNALGQIISAGGIVFLLPRFKGEKVKGGKTGREKRRD